MFAVAIQTVEILAHPPKEIPHALIVYYKWTEYKPEYLINLFKKRPPFTYEKSVAKLCTTSEPLLLNRAVKEKKIRSSVR
jgi:hypothetical protein